MDAVKIMVVDDDPSIRAVLEVNLSARGYEVVALSSGQEALDLVAQMRPDVVLLDVMMPDMDGWEVLKILKDTLEPEMIKVLMLTAKNTERDKMIGESILKADGYMTKPFDIGELLLAIERLIEEN